MEKLIDLGLWSKKTVSESWKPMRPVPKGIETPKGVEHFKHGRPKRTWEYRELDGQLIGLIHRFEKTNSEGGIDKTLIPMCYCYSDKGGKSWTWKSFDKPRPLYNLPLFKKYPDVPVIMFEGEKTADAGQVIFKDKFVCSTWPGGAAAVKYCDTKYLKGRKVILWPDNDPPGMKAMTELAEILIQENNTPHMVDLPSGLPEGWDVADEVPDGFIVDYHLLVNKAEQFIPVSDTQIAMINREYAFIVSGGRPAVLFENKDIYDGSVGVEYWSTEAFKQYFGNQTVPSGRNQVKLGDYWLIHPDRRTYRGLTFEPGRDRPGYYNLWHGYSFEPDEAGDWSLFKEHLIKNVCQEDESLFRWVFGWFSDIVQNPGQKSGTSLSLRGNQGAGKTIVGKIFGRLIQRHYTLIDQERYLFGNFNSHMASTILLHSDEGFWGGDPRHVGKLKSLVTSDTQRVEHKGRDSVQVNNYLRLLITTNTEWVIPAAFDERRFAVLDVGNGNQQDRSYFLAMLDQMEHGGYGALLYDMMKFDLKSIDIRELPATMALSQQKESSMDPVELYWFTCLQQGNSLLMSKTGWLGTVKTAELHEDCVAYLNMIGHRRMPTLNSFFRKLRMIAPPEAFIRKLIGPDRQSATTLPSLNEAREYFDKMMRVNHDWLSFDLEDDNDLVGHKKEKRVSEEIPF